MNQKFLKINLIHLFLFIFILNSVKCNSSIYFNTNFFKASNSYQNRLLSGNMNDQYQLEDILPRNQQNNASNSPMPDFECFYNVSSDDIFYTNSKIKIRYSIYSANTPYFYAIFLNRTSLNHSYINHEISQFSVDLDTSISGYFNLTLNIYSSEVKSINDINSDFLVYELSANIRIHPNLTDKPQFPSDRFSLDIFSSEFILITFISLLGISIGIFGIRKYNYIIRQGRLKKLNLISQNPSTAKQFATLQQKNPFFPRKTHDRIIKRCIEMYPEYNIDPHILDEDRFWNEIIHGGNSK